MNFVEQIAPYAQKYMKSEGILASLTIAQAILESDSGKSELAVKANNLFGIKAKLPWTGEVYKKATKEYVNNKWVEVLAPFCKFVSLEECFEYRSKVFLKRQHYKPLWGISDYKNACRIIWKCGYATDPHYPQKLIDIIEKNKLYEYDKELISVPTLMIDPGHGGKDPGASKNGQNEKDWTLKVSLYQFERFKELGVSVGLTRSTDITLDSDDRAALVKNSGAKYCISNHLNASGGDRGEVIHSIYADGKLAHKFKDALLAAGQTSVRVYFRQNSAGSDYYYMHRETGAVETNIIEYCFIDNAKDFEHFRNNWEAYAEAVVKAFCSHIGHAYTAPKKEGVGKMEQNLTPAQEKIRQEAIRLGLTDGKNPFREVNQFYVWACLIPLAQRVEELETKLK